MLFHKVRAYIAQPGDHCGDCTNPRATPTPSYGQALRYHLLHSANDSSPHQKIQTELAALHRKNEFETMQIIRLHAPTILLRQWRRIRPETLRTNACAD